MFQGNIQYTAIMLYQLFMICVTFGYILLLFQKRLSHVSRRMQGVAFMGLLYNLSYLLELMAGSMEEALPAVMFEIVSMVFYATFLLFMVAKYCNVVIRGWIKTVLLVLDCWIVICAWCYKITPIYFTPVEFNMDRAIPYMVVERGFVDNFFHVYYAVQLIICLVIECVRIRTARFRGHKVNYYYLLGGTLVPFLGSMLGSLRIVRSFNIAPGSIALGLLIFMVGAMLEHVLDIAATAHEALIEDMDMAIVIADETYCFVEANKKAYEFYPELSMMKQGDPLNKFGLADTNKTVEYTRDDRHYEVHLNEIKDGERTLCYSIMTLDMTEKKQHLVHIEQLREEAEKANQAKTMFLASVSHEIRTPINSVIGMNEMILRESEEEQIIQYASDIKSAASSLLGIINNILDITKIESGKMQIMAVHYELSNLLNNVLGIMQERADEKKLELRVEVAPYLPNQLVGDDVRVRQVLVNLLSNAIKYTHSGYVVLRVGGYRERNRAFLRFEVEDSGCGIRQEDLPKIYAAFERIDMEQNRYVEGTGLGMNIITQLLRMMGSRLEVKSEYGKGSLFAFEMRQKVYGDELIGNFREKKQQSQTVSKYKVSFTAPAARILLVDDNKVNRKVFINLVKGLKIQVTDVESGRECLQVVKKDRFDLIFMDHMMPEMDGVETMEKMNQMQEHLNKNTPVIMLTANAMVGAREQYLNVGFSEFLPKPIIPEKLERLLLQFLPDELIHTEPETDLI